ncbi:MAG TPA: RNA 2',3'-cyclic phosphodiesterase [Ktedonobacteraceae bacterium]|jgi:2'-5' RNA ligase
MTRTFVALEMNEAVQRHLESVIRQVTQVLPGLRWVDPFGIHITLAFLGELTDDELGGVKHAAQAAAQRGTEFSYSLSRIGMFGLSRQPRVIWMGIEEPTGALKSLQRHLTQELVRRNFQMDRRPFSPHLTLARIKTPLSPEELQQLQLLLDGPQQGLLTSELYPVRHIAVMKSELSLSGARYTPLQTYALPE